MEEGRSCPVLVVMEGNEREGRRGGGRKEGHTLLVGMGDAEATVANSLQVPQRTPQRNTVHTNPIHHPGVDLWVPVPGPCVPSLL